MRRLFVATVFAALMALPGVAVAGGTAVVDLSSTPAGIAPGEPWTVDITVLQHGLHPVAGAKPSITVRNAQTGEQIEYPAKATVKKGVYRARVVFPTAGSWIYEVYDGFEKYGGAKTHTFPAADIGNAGAADAARPAAERAFPLWSAGIWAFAGIAAFVLVVVVSRRRKVVAVS